MSLSATAIYDPNNTVTDPNSSGPQLMKTTAEPVPISAERDYSIDFEQETARCGGQGVDNASITSLKVSPDETTVNVDGVFQTQHPNYNLSHNIEKVEDKHYILRLNGVETSNIAPTCIGNIEYSANFTSSEGYLLEVYHNDTKIEEKQMPTAVNGSTTSPEPSENQQSETEKEDSKGFFADILESLENLF